MHKMMQLRDKLSEELEMFADKPVNDQNLEYVDKLAHAIKCIDTVVAMHEGEIESRGTSGRMYRDDSTRGYSGADGGTSGRRRRDSMGRYSNGYSNGYSGRYSRDEAKDRLIEEMEGMMDGVSPEAQHAIEKAIHALGQE